MKSPQYLHKHAQYRPKTIKSHTRQAINSSPSIHCTCSEITTSTDTTSIRKTIQQHNYKQYITIPSASNNSNPTFTRPSPSYNRSDNQHIPRPSPSPPRYNTHPAFPGPAHYSHYLQHIPGPYTAFPPYLHQNFITGPYQQTPPIPAPYQQTPGHFPQRVYYVPIILPHYTI